MTRQMETKSPFYFKNPNILPEELLTVYVRNVAHYLTLSGIINMEENIKLTRLSYGDWESNKLALEIMQVRYSTQTPTQDVSNIPLQEPQVRESRSS